MSPLHEKFVVQEYGGFEFAYSTGLFENWHGIYYCAYVAKIDRCFFFPSFKFLAFWFQNSTFFLLQSLGLCEVGGCDGWCSEGG